MAPFPAVVRTSVCLSWLSSFRSFNRLSPDRADDNLTQKKRGLAHPEPYEFRSLRPFMGIADKKISLRADSLSLAPEASDYKYNIPAKIRQLLHGAAGSDLTIHCRPAALLLRFRCLFVRFYGSNQY
jgi:hypothetical protein